MINKLRVPKHIGVIPDGNRRWAVNRGLKKEDGYKFGVDKGFELFKECVDLGIKELTLFGFTQDNTKRPSIQKESFTNSCIDAVRRIDKYDANLLVVGDYESNNFPKDLLEFKNRKIKNEDFINVNFLVNYDWKWDVNGMYGNDKKRNPINSIRSKDISRIDLVIRWGERRRLSGFLPLQTVYSDIYIVDKMWPDFKVCDLYQALYWYKKQDITLGG